jgi:predicted dehydrogenase
MFKICVVGCGGIANQMHGHAYKKYASLHADTLLACCCDIDEEKAAKFRDQFGFLRYHTDFLAMLREEKPDAVCLNAPVHKTAEMSAAILKEGYPLILEKPPGRNREELMSIIEAAEQGNVPHQVAFNRRFIPETELLCRELRTGFKNGDIQNISCEFFRVNRRDNDFSTTAIHGIDTVRYIADSDYEEVHFFYQEMPGLGKDICNTVMQCRFVSGATAQLRFFPMTGIRLERITVNVKSDTYMALLPYQDSLDAPGRLLHYRDNALVKEISGGELCGSLEIFETNGFYREDEAFFDAIREGKQPVSQLRSAIQSVELGDCIRRRIPYYQEAISK